MLVGSHRPHGLAGSGLFVERLHEGDEDVDPHLLAFAFEDVAPVGERVGEGGEVAIQFL